MIGGLNYLMDLEYTTRKANVRLPRLLFENLKKRIEMTTVVHEVEAVPVGFRLPATVMEDEQTVVLDADGMVLCTAMTPGIARLIADVLNLTGEDADGFLV